jgi:PBP1b-binding outer membrane lipoprotein LpoB
MKTTLTLLFIIFIIASCSSERTPSRHSSADDSTYQIQDSIINLETDTMSR